MHDCRLPCALFAVSLALFVGACDKPPPPPADYPQTPASKTAAPTTQQILDGPRTPLVLGNLPFTMAVPAGWAVHDHGPAGTSTLQMLEGPILGGDVHVMLRQRDSVSPERVKALIELARRDARAINKPGQVIDIYDLGDIRVIERRQTRSLPTSQPAGAPQAGEPIEWRLTLFSASGINFEHFELQFIALSETQFYDNEKLLRGLIQSLKPLDLSRPPI